MNFLVMYNTVPRTTGKERKNSQPFINETICDIPHWTHVTTCSSRYLNGRNLAVKSVVCVVDMSFMYERMYVCVYVEPLGTGQPPYLCAYDELCQAR